MTGSRECIGSRPGGTALLACALGLAIALVGCVTLPTPLPPDHPMSLANEYMAKWATQRKILTRQAEAQRKAQSTRPLDLLGNKLFGDAPVKPVEPRVPRPKVTQGSGYRELVETYDDAYDGPVRWKDAYRSACARISGTLVADAFCTSDAYPDRVLFMVSFQPGGWGSGAWMRITLVEPTSQPPTGQFMQLVYIAGFQTRAERDRARQAAEAAAAKQAAAERARLAVDWARMRVRGQMVCRYDDGIRYVGYVEDFTDERIKVSVTQAIFGSTGYTLGGFKPGIIWTTQEGGWAPCEWVRR